MEYKILETDSSSNLKKQVNEYISRGWKPQGGISISFSTTSTYSITNRMHFAQAMVKGDL